MKSVTLISIEIAILILQFVSNSLLVVTHTTTNINTDEVALLSLKAHVTDTGNVISSHWSVSTPVCNWLGVTCKIRHGRVATLNLRNFGLVGTIPSHLGNLSFLEHLDLSNNTLHGNIPKELARLRRLNYLNLRFNYLDGDMPGWLGSLAKLRHLGLTSNKLSGSLPVELSNLTMLKAINLGNLNLPNLKGLYLSINNLNGRRPSSIKLCSKLQDLSISVNKLSGPIPGEIWNLTTLRTLYLGYNYLKV
ncbi:hypothetical protein Leryth_024800 [Lithospermum erythrorhizon]|nr:hypothetical protein Leryth_024800 [Lithospermum erythrorhizon]